MNKIDRASMAIALETRVPLLDHRVVEFAWRIPRNDLICGGVSKWPLNRSTVMCRRSLSIGLKWGLVFRAERLRRPLRDWAEALLDLRRLKEAGLVDAAVVRRHWQQHLSGRHNWQYLLWDMLVLEAWRERWIG